MPAYYVGDTVRLAVAFRDPSNALTNPTTVSLSITTNGSTVVLNYPSSGILNPTIGNYTYNLTLTVAGSITYEWIGTGAVNASRFGGFDAEAARTSPVSFWTPANDHLIFDGLETLVLTKLDGTTQTILRCLRLPANLDIGSAGALVGYGNVVRWNLWIQECPVAPEINAKLTDSLGYNFRINNVTQSVVRNMWEIEATADAGVGL